MSFNSKSTDEAEKPDPATAQGTKPSLPFHKEQEKIEQELHNVAEENLAKYEYGVGAERNGLLQQLNATATVWGLENLENSNPTGDNGKTTPSKKEEISEGDSESDSKSDSKDWSKPDAVGWKSAADGSRLQPEAIKLILDFFRDRQHVNRAECEEYCFKAYQEKGIGSYTARERPFSVHAYPSESQFRNSYMVEIIDTTIPRPAFMTQFFITPGTLDAYQLAIAKHAYGNFVPEYTYVGNMGLAPNHPELFVWRIDSPAGRPFAANGYRLGLRVNQDKYVGILKDFIDFVCEPLWRRGGGDHLSNARDWPMVLQNPLLDVYNIIVRPDWSGIACVLLWAEPPALKLPFGASLCGVLCLLGYPDRDLNKNGIPNCKANPSLFKGYSRNALELQRFCMYYLREKHLTLTNKIQSWRDLGPVMTKGIATAVNSEMLELHRLFMFYPEKHLPPANKPQPLYHLCAAMAKGVSTAANLDELDRTCYEARVLELVWDLLQLERKPGVPDESAVACAESGRGGEDGDVDMDVDMDGE